MTDTALLQSRSRSRRRGQALVGALLVVLGVVGLSFTVAGPAVAGDAADRHEAMHRVMDAMHGEGTADRVHAVEGGEQMMEDCAGMMGAMSSMGSMMRTGA